MPILRIIAVIQALSLIIGETYRSWGAGRHWLFVVDDYWISALLLLGAWAMKGDSLRNRALFAAGWGAQAGMLYGSFFGKLIEPSSSNPGNFGIGVLTWLIGLAWLVSVIGVFASVMLPGGHVPKVRVPATYRAACSFSSTRGCSSRLAARMPSSPNW